MAEGISAGWFGPGLLLQQEPSLTDPDVDDDQDMVTCPECLGTGLVDGGVCPLCGGTGQVPAAEDEYGQDGRAARAKYSSKRSALGLSASLHDEFEVELEVTTPGGRSPAGTAGQTERDRAERDWQCHRDSLLREWLERRFAPPRLP